MAVKKRALKRGVKKTSVRVEQKKIRKELAQVQQGIASVKIEQAKRSVIRIPRPLLLPKREYPQQTFTVSARMVEANGKSTFLARVPAILTTIPEIPDVVMCEGKFFTLTTTVPMTYTQRLYAEAVRI